MHNNEKNTYPRMTLRPCFRYIILTHLFFVPLILVLAGMDSQHFISADDQLHNNLRTDYHQKGTYGKNNPLYRALPCGGL